MRVSIIGLKKQGVNLACRLTEAGMNVEILELYRKNDSQGKKMYHTGESKVIIFSLPAGAGTCFLYQTLNRLRLQKGVLLAAATTVMPGTAEHIREIMTQRGWVAGEDFYFVLTPFHNEINPEAGGTAPQIISGLTPACLARGLDFFAHCVARLVPIKDIRIAEMVPIIQNAHRFMHVSFAQEVKDYCTQNLIDWHVLRFAVNMAGLTLPEVCAGAGDDLPRDMAFLQGFCPSPLFEGALAADVRYRHNLYQRVKEGQHVLIIGLGMATDGDPVEWMNNPTAQLICQLQHKGCHVYVQDEHISPGELAAFGLKPPNPQVKYDVIFTQGEIYQSGED